MAKSIFYIDFNLKDNKKSILQLSYDFIDLMSNLSEIDPVFQSPLYVYDEKKLQINLGQENRESSVLKLANIILDSFKSDIRQMDKVENPTIEFSRDFGFRLLFQYFKNNKKAFSIMTKLGASEYQELKIEFFKTEFEYDFTWYFSVLKAIVKYWEPVQAGVIVRLPTFFDPFKSLKVWPPLGWISYFSNDGAIKIPDDLNGVEYVHTEKGKFIILTREDFTISKEVFETHRDKLLEIMKEVKSRVPEYTEK